jgi:uncharacterized repeat protein (TIGR01451 family)
LAYDASRNALWGTASHFGGALETSIRSIDLGTGLPKGFVSLDYPASKIVASANDKYLFASFFLRTDINYPPRTYGVKVHRIDLSTNAIDLTFSATDGVGQQELIEDMIGIASYPGDVLISGAAANTDVTLYENGVAIRRTTNEVGGGKLAINPAIPTRLYMLVGGYGQDSFVRLNIESNQISELLGSDFIALPVTPDNPTTGEIRAGGGLLFSDIGIVADPEALTNLTWLPVTGPVVVDSSMGLVFYLVQDGSQWTLTAFDLGTLQVKWSYLLSGVIGNVLNFICLQPGVLAFDTDGDQIFILNSTQLAHPLQADLQLTQTASTTATTTNVPVTFTTTVVNAGPAPAINVVLTNELTPDALVGAISSSQGSVTNLSNNIVCTVGNLQVGKSAWLQVTATFNHAGTLTNQAALTQGVPDPVLTNNFSINTVDFSTIPVSDLVVSQSSLRGSLVPGSNVIQTVTISNAGPDIATNVQLTDYVFAGATIVSATSDRGTVSVPGPGTLLLNVDALTNSTMATVTMILSPSGGASVLNGASVGTSTFDPNLLNNQSIATQLLSTTNGQSLMDQVPILVSDIAYDTTGQRIIASTVSGQWPFTNGLLGIPVSNESAALVAPVPNTLGRVTLSDDGHYAYVAIVDTGGVARVDLPARSVDLRFAINTPTAEFGPFVVEDFAVMPESPSTLAVARGGYAGYSSAVALFDDGVQRPHVMNNLIANASYFRIGFANAGTLYTTQPNGFQAAAITATGLTNQGALFPGYVDAFVIDHGMVFLRNGTVLDPTNGTSVASFPVTGPVWPDLANERVYFMTDQNTVRAFDWNTQLELWSVPFVSFGAPFLNYQQSLISLGTNGLACLTDSGQVCILHTAQLATASTDLSVIASGLPTSISVGDSLSYTLTIQNFGPWTASGVVVANPFPETLSFSSASSTQGVCTFTNGILTCALSRMTNGSVASVTINAVARAVGSTTNAATVTANETDFVPGNNLALLALNVSPAPPPPSLALGDAIAVQAPFAGTITFPLTLSSPSDKTISISYQTADGTALAGKDYSPASGVITIDPGQTGFNLNLRIILSNLSANQQTYFLLNLTAVTNATMARGQAVGTIVQKFFYGISIGNVTIENRGTDTNVIFQLTSSPGNPLPVSLEFQTIDGTAIAGQDYEPRAGLLTFDPGVTNATIAVPVFGNSISNAVKTFSILLSDPINAVLNPNEAIATVFQDALLTALQLDAVQVQATNVLVEFQSILGRLYQLERTDNLATPSWTIVADKIPGNGGSTTVLDSTGGAALSRFYRLVLLP